jgi:hypothetical protein
MGWYNFYEREPLYGGVRESAHRIEPFDEELVATSSTDGYAESLKAVAGRLTNIKLTVKNTGATALTGLTVEINLPSDCCFVKGGAHPSLKKTTSTTPTKPIVQRQNVYWLNFLLAAHKASSFSLKARASSLYMTATTLPITAYVYATNVTALATCVTSAPAKTVSATWVGGCMHMCVAGRSVVQSIDLLTDGAAPALFPPHSIHTARCHPLQACPRAQGGGGA